MKRNILRITGILLSISAALIVLTVPRVAYDSPIQDGARTIKPAEKTVDQVFKNIKVLNGIPQSKLYPTMRFMAASLGFQCGSCHISRNGVIGPATFHQPIKGIHRKMCKKMIENIPSHLSGEH